MFEPAELRTLDAIHLATAQRFGSELGQLVTYDDRMITAAAQLGIRTAAPA
jgi:predicted nucleic acid-binding protein